ncbi:motility associated factor glycosyltransferase family protein [Rheinheimera oceanensis]|uniref:motility associated factor glycosyltransferase family protein n=1 Tax=Rheinheimera oceanensis TaxID=2817449 RepID=UPI001BFEA71F|nr:6-hydroxymethylpterin diphosphokinase MptE-like protein [Rheinheimera oceanensis]
MINDCFAQNMRVIASRWPTLADVLQQAAAEKHRPAVQLIEGQDNTLLINGIQLTSRHNRQQEALQQISKLPQHYPHITLYGTGLGDMQQQLLSRERLQQLSVCILNEYIFALVLQLLDQRHWLSDSRVSLQLAASQSDIQLPFAVLPSELVLASDDNMKTRDRLYSELEAGYAAQRLRQDVSTFLPRLQQNQPFWQQDQQVQVLFNSLAADKDVYVIGAGPSLEQHYGFIRQAQQQANAPLLICVDTAVKALLAQDIRPDIIVSRDHKITLKHLPCSSLTAASSLVYFPLANPELLQHFPGTRYIALSDSAVFNPVRKQLAAAVLFSHGSVIHPAVDLAVKMGAKRVLLFGADFAFSHNKTHASWQNGALGPGYQAATEQVINGFGEKVPTLRNLLTYLTGLERYISKQPAVSFVNTSKAGAVIAGTQYHTELAS